MAALNEYTRNRLQVALGHVQDGDRVYDAINRLIAASTTFTQTYDTATATHAAPTAAAVTDNSGGSATSAVADVGSSFSQSDLNDIHASLVAQINALIVDVANVKQVLNQVIDALQTAQVVG